MNRDASSTDHDIPALILKECKNNISYPVFLIWKESFESEVIPEDMKIQSITPIFKKVISLILETIDKDLRASNQKETCLPP